MTGAAIPENISPAQTAPVADTSTNSAPAPVIETAAPVAVPESTAAETSAPATDPVDVLGGEGPIAEEAPATEEAKPSEEKKDAPTDAPKEGEKPKEGDAENAPADALKEGAPVELPTYEEFTLPENFNVDKDSMGELTKLLGEMEIGKLDHTGMQAKGQEIINLGTKVVQQSIERLNDFYVGIHEKQKADWFQEFKSDPEIGGARTNTTINNVRDAITTYAGTPEQIARFRADTQATGITNNPSVIRLINNMAETIKKFTTENEVGSKDTRIVPGARPAPTKVKGYQSFYKAN